MTTEEEAQFVDQVRAGLARGAQYFARNGEPLTTAEEALEALLRDGEIHRRGDPMLLLEEEMGYRVPAPRKWIKREDKDGKPGWRIYLPDLFILDENMRIFSKEAQLEHFGQAIVYALGEARKTRSAEKQIERLEFSVALAVYCRNQFGHYPEIPESHQAPWECVQRIADGFARTLH